MQIYIDLNSLPTAVYSIQLNNIFIYSLSNFLFLFFNKTFVFLDDEYKQILKDMGNGLSLVSILNINSPEDTSHSIDNCPLPITEKGENFEEKYSFPIVQQEENFDEKYCVQQEEMRSINSYPSPSYELNEQDKILFEKIWNNRLRIQIQHEQLMTKASRLICFSSINYDSFKKEPFY
jgi:hypothetical protein